jgi:very-short-patch-repair endonuclease
LSGKSWRRIGTGLYRWSGLPDDPWLTLSAWRRVLPQEAVFAGASAAWLLGLDLPPTDPVEVVVPPWSGIRTRTGLLVRHCEISSVEVVSVRGLSVLVLPLTLAGLCLQRPAVEALVVIDMAVQRGLTDPAALVAYAEVAKGRAGISRLRALAPLAAPAESPMESRLRWLLLQGGLPRPDVQTNLCDAASRFVARADLYYPAARLVVEYDGGNHRDRLVEDDRRQNLLINAGYRVLRFTAADIHGRPDAVVAQVRASLGRQSVRSAHNGHLARSKKSVLRRTHRIVMGWITARSGSGSGDTRR